MLQHAPSSRTSSRCSTNIETFSRFQFAAYVDRLPAAVFFRACLYPPVWLLVMLPFGLLAVGTAFMAFMALTAGVATLIEGRRDG